MSQAHLQQQCIGFLNTPPLWLNEQFKMQQFAFPDIEMANFRAQPIPQQLRLGHQMEYVFKQLIEHCPEYKILLHNLPIKQGKQTIGEIDFVLKPAYQMGKKVETVQLIHVELTYKFYIINPNISEPIHQLMGPNKRDMFYTKMEKIKNEQFKLLHSEEGSKALSDNNIDHKNIIHSACYKAQLFAPYGSDASNIRPLNKACIVGCWLRFDEYNTTEFKSYQFYIPFKSEWVIAPHTNVQWRSHFETLMDINLRLLKENAPMVWMKKSDTEFEKFFVVWWK